MRKVKTLKTNINLNKMKLTEQKLREIIRAELIAEASLSKIHKAAKKGSYPVTIVVISNGMVVKQELVGTPAIVPAAFNVIQKEYPNAIISIESRTGETLFSESKTNESVELVHVYNVDGSLYGTGELVKTKGKKSLVRWDGSNEEWYSSDLVKLTEAVDSNNFDNILKLRGESVDLGEELESLLVDMKDVRSNMEDEGEDGDTKSYGKELNKLEAKYNATKTKLNKVNTKIDKLDQF